MSFARLSERFGRARKVDGLPEEWVSPYRLLWGAAYSIGIAERSMEGLGEVSVPQDLSSFLIAAVQDERALPWFRFWNASYMLTNAIYRVAAASEKICVLAANPRVKDRRGWLWNSVREPGSALSVKVPKAHELLHGMPERDKRPGFLQLQRLSFPGSGGLTQPLVCAFIQTDTDKHVAYKPLKELAFDVALASESFMEACDLWDAAAAAA